MALLLHRPYVIIQRVHKHTSHDERRVAGKPDNA